jgi:hypothetical protein
VVELAPFFVGMNAIVEKTFSEVLDEWGYKAPRGTVPSDVTYRITKLMNERTAHGSESPYNILFLTSNHDVFTQIALRVIFPTPGYFECNICTEHTKCRLGCKKYKSFIKGKKDEVYIYRDMGPHGLDKFLEYPVRVHLEHNLYSGAYVRIKNTNVVDGMGHCNYQDIIKQDDHQVIEPNSIVPHLRDNLFSRHYA